MTVHRSIRRSLALAVVALALLLPASLLAAGGLEYFMGGGSSLDPQGAVQAATWDAEGCAASVGMYTCSLAGEPEIFARPDPRWGIRYTAQVTLGCTP
jgi:hypothetical protein